MKADPTSEDVVNIKEIEISYGTATKTKQQDNYKVRACCDAYYEGDVKYGKSTS